MHTFLAIVTIFAALVLIVVVLVQNSKGGGLASNFSSSNQIMGAPKTADFLEKLTWGLVIVIFVLSLATAKLIQSDSVTNKLVAPQETSLPNVDSNLPAEGTNDLGQQPF